MIRRRTDDVYKRLPILMRLEVDITPNLLNKNCTICYMSRTKDRLDQIAHSFNPPPRTRTAMTTRDVELFTGKRVTLTTSTPYDDVLARLDKEIKSESLPVKELLATKDITVDEFIKRNEARAGPAGFMHFLEFNHGDWIKVFGVGKGLKMKRIILGNPLIAITMLRHDLNAGMYVPIELLIRELEGRKGTMLVYFLPSSLIAGVNGDEELGRAARVLDSRFEKLLEQVTA
jgi:uncharacterized protein (DUF302 family)